MRIKKVILTNYRQFRNATIDFRKSKRNDLYVIIGRGGTGKTNFFNSINWCFYGKEPLFENLKKLPILNLKEVGNSTIKSVKVEVLVEDEEVGTMRFIREKDFKLYGNNKEPTEFRENFSLYQSNTGDILNDDQASLKLNQLFPSTIKEFFFFDGEKLDKYFQENKGEAIKGAIFNISQLNVLERIEERLETLNNESRRELGRLNPRIDQLREQRELKAKSLNDINSRIDSIIAELNGAKSKIKELREELSKYPDVERLAKNKDEIKAKYDEKQNISYDKKKDLQNLIFEFYKLFTLYKCIKEGLDSIEEERKNGNLPPTNDKGVLESSLKVNKCLICGRYLDKESHNYIQKIISDTKISTEIGNILLLMEQDLLNYKEFIDNFSNKHTKINNEINMYNKDLSDLNRQLEDIQDVLGKHPVERIRQKNQDWRDLEELVESKNQDLGSFRAIKEKINEEIQKLDDDIQKEAEKVGKANEIQGMMTFCAESYKVVVKAKEEIMREIKQEIEKNTKKLFLDMVWKKDTFAEVKIDDSYNISVINTLGYDCVGSLSASERLLLTLSFIIAMHRVSGFDSPLLIDTPIARTSDKNRANLGKTFCDISDKKQVILLLTPDEYSTDISEILDEVLSKRFNLALSQDKHETTIEEVKSC